MSLKLRGFLAGFILVGVLFKVMPNFVNMDGKWWPAKGKIVYGLDIQGGVQLVMGIDTEAVMKEKLVRLVRSLEDTFKAENVNTKSVAVQDEKNHEIKIELANPADETKVRDLIEKNHKGMIQILSTSSTDVTPKIYDTQINEMRKQVLDQAIGVIRNRIDEVGVAKPLSQAQG